MKTLIIIPAYNEEKNIKRVVENLIENFPQYDYIVINDGSSDKTEQVCMDNNFSYITLPVNLGLAGAFKTGMKYAYKNNYDVALQFDGDGQHLPEHIKDMEKCLEKEKAHIVIGSRFVNTKRKFSMRMLGNILISCAIKLTTGKTIKDPTSGMRLFNKEMIEEFSKKINYAPEPDTISYLIKNGVKVSEVQVNMTNRVAGESYLNWSRSIKYMMYMFVSIMFIQFFRKR